VGSSLNQCTAEFSLCNTLVLLLDLAFKQHTSNAILVSFWVTRPCQTIFPYFPCKRGLGGPSCSFRNRLLFLQALKMDHVMEQRLNHVYIQRHSVGCHLS